ncbi:hypothetical protein K525DRAFT_234645 [Schizophyllum commune Loenen D]|nr:hypothetical protein K525DRAFT_234645 [Schizophyllum commune Loenen D]
MSIQDALPPSLNLPPHLSAHKYFMVCTMTVAAWDTLVLAPRTWKLMRTEGWPALKALFYFIRVFMPVEFTIVAVAFFDTKWSQNTCQQFYLFEPICTAVLIAASSAAHVIRIYGIYDKSRQVLAGMGALFALQVAVTAVACGFWRSVPLEEGQGCIAGPKHTWVGIYWVAPTLLYAASFALALSRSFASLKLKPMGLWKLMLRDGLNLFGAVFLVNLVNMIFWFVIQPTGSNDPIKTMVSSMTAVLTSTMTLRIILAVRGPLAHGGTFALSGSTSTATSRTTHVISTRSGGVVSGANASHAPHTYTLDDMRGGKPDEWATDELKSRDLSAAGDKDDALVYHPDIQEGPGAVPEPNNLGVKITVDREARYENENWK